MLIEGDNIEESTNNSNNIESTESNNEEVVSNADIKWPLYGAKEHDEKFAPMAYLEDFYKTPKEDEAMQTVLFFLPGILYRIPDQVEDVLDLGAGPTVYIPIIMRNRVRNFYTSDYSLANRDVLKSWIKNECTFDWTEVCKWISGIEASHKSPNEMQAIARSNMRAVFEVNVYKDPVIQSVHYKVEGDVSIPQQFDVVTTVFCLEYATETPQDYKKVVKNASNLVKKGGFLVQGGVLEANEYSFGGRRFKCHYLTREELLHTLKDCGFSTEQKSKDFHMIYHDEIFLLVAKKL